MDHHGGLMHISIAQERQRNNFIPFFSYDMGVSKNSGILPAKWMVYFMENPTKMGWFGG